ETAIEQGRGSLPGERDELPTLSRPAYRLASPGQVGWTAFLGGPIGGFLLMGRNYAKCGRKAASLFTVAVGVLIIAALIGIDFVLPLSPGLNLRIGLPLWLGTYVTAKLLQQKLYNAHRKQGGERVSGWQI